MNTIRLALPAFTTQLLFLLFPVTLTLLSAHRQVKSTVKLIMSSKKHFAAFQTRVQFSLAALMKQLTIVSKGNFVLVTSLLRSYTCP